MHISLFVDSLYNSAGIERMTVLLANSLNRKGHRVEIILCSSSKESYYLLDSDVIISSLYNDFSNYIACQKKLYKHIKHNRPDLLINVAIHMGFISIPVLKILHVPIISWEHFHLKAGNWKGYLFRLISAVFSDATVVLTKKDRGLYPKFLQHNIHVIYNYSALYNDKKYVREKIILSIGRLSAQKRFDKLIEIWASIQDKINGWKLIIVGGGELESELCDKIKFLNLSDSISIIPPRKDVETLYKMSSIYAMTSDYEGLPLVLIEAKQFGLPSISYNCPNGPDEIIEDNVDGFIVSNNNYKEFERKLLLMMDNPRLLETFGAKAEFNFNEKFSENVIISNWETLFNKICNKYDSNRSLQH